MTIGNRIRLIRKQAGLNQTEFGAKIGLKQTAIGLYENDQRGVADRTILLICEKFGINETWLRTGNGEMFVEDDNTLLDQLSKQYNLDDFSRRFIKTYIKLPEAQKKAVKDFAYAVFASETKDVEIASEPSFSHNNRHELTESEIDAECENYRHQLELEKREKEKSLASHDTKMA